jgi:WD40 repeat protein
MRTFQAHRKDVQGLAFTPDGRTLVSVGGQSWAAFVWDARTGDQVYKLPGRRERGWSVACGPGGLVAAGDKGNTIRVWRLPGGERVAGITLPPRAHPDPDSDDPRYTPARDLAFLPDGKGLVTAAEQLRVWDLVPPDPPYREAPTYHHQFTTVGVSPDGVRVAFGSRDGAVGCWWPATGAWRGVADLKKIVHALAFAPAADELAVAYGHQTRVIDLASGRARLDLAGHDGMVWKVAYTPDGSRLVTASSDGTVRFWDAATGASRGSFDWQTGKVRCVAVSPDGLTVASGGQDGRIVIADVEP